MTDSTERPETGDFPTEKFQTESFPTEPSPTNQPTNQPTTGQSPTDQAPAAAPRPPVRMSTVVWGLIIVVIGGGILARALGAEFDNELALIVLLCVGGVALVVTSIVSAVRKK